ncbi:hypothetical protein FOL47_000056 [Perkinsus chesapeaki]|uniref:Uncharacterized protein n=1 Tax=Perkinsus chesapeaki TaxID=330153 RepID=A0A7J6N440_PERCH|nr:hypothetical protein FOL47_000056 [Perkinsus chesapeaki]
MIIPVWFFGFCGYAIAAPNGIYINATVYDRFYWMLFPDNKSVSTGTFDLGGRSEETTLYDGAGIPYKYDERNPLVITLDQSSPVLHAFLNKYHLCEDEWKELKYDEFKGKVIISVNGTEIVHYHD